MYAEVKFNFWLCARWSCGYFTAVCKNKLQHIALRQLYSPFLAGLKIPTLTQFVIEQLHYSRPIDGLGRIVTVSFHHPGNLLLAIHSFFSNGYEILFVKAELYIEINQFLKKCSSLIFFISSHLTQDGYRGYRVFITQFRPDHQAVTLLTTDHIVLTGFFFFNQFCYPFKTGKNIVTLDIASLSNHINHVGSYNRFYHHVV